MGDDEDLDISAPCFSHQLVDGNVIDPQTVLDVARFRRAERERLYALRKAQSLTIRKQRALELKRLLDKKIDFFTNQTIAVYWPIRGEIDLTDWMIEAHNNGIRLTLPIVVEKAQPLEFHSWTPNTTMTSGFWNIPCPPRTTAQIPDIVVAPLLGVDNDGYRLGNGGGYYDRTLSRLPKTTHVIGVGAQFCVMKTIFPQPWDIAMDEVILVN